MLIDNGDNTFTAGPADILCILKLPAGKFHAAFFEEHPMPGPIEPLENLPAIRLKSKMHHTAGSETLEGAQQHLRELREAIRLSDNNVLSEVAIDVVDPVSNWLVPNWTTGRMSLKNAIIEPREEK